MSVLDAELAILDEIDSGLDIDALKDVASAVNGLTKPETATIMVTHYKVTLHLQANTQHLHSSTARSQYSWAVGDPHVQMLLHPLPYPPHPPPPPIPPISMLVKY